MKFKDTRMENQSDAIESTNVISDQAIPIQWIIAISISTGVLLVLTLIGIIFLCRRIKNSKTEQFDANSDQFRILRCKNRYSSSDSGSLRNDSHNQIAEEVVKPKMTITRVQPKSRPTSSHYHRLSLPAVYHDDASGTSDEEEDAVQRFANVNGRIWYSLRYEHQASQLHVTIIKARYLRARGMSHEARDPFVRVCLLPDEVNYQQTKCRRRSLSPSFNETLHFQVNPDEVSSKTVKISVYDIDRKKVRHTLGHALVPLEKVDLTNKSVMWKNLDASLKKRPVGELYFSLCVNTYSHRIKIALLRGRDFNFKQVPITEQTELYIRVEFYYGSKLVKFKDTTKQKFNENPNIFQNFSFSVLGKHFDSHSIALVAVVCTGDKDIKFGRVSVGSLLYAHGDELKHWQDMMSNPRTPIERWHFLTEVT